jgi:phosphoglucosamine mutase
MGEYFGTDGIRGVAGKFPLDQTTIERIGYSLAMELRAKLRRAPLVLIGRDTRESGAWIEAAIARGIHTAEAEVQSAGIVTTPGVAYLTRALKADAGVVISASHNPYQDNGLKVFAPSGRKLDDATEQAIERDLKADPATFPPIVSAAVTPDETLTEKYFDFLRDEIGAGLDLKDLEIVLDCGNGAAYEIAPLLFASLGAVVRAINIEPDGRNINLAGGSLHPERLQEVVLKAGADLGIAFDGDADRALFVDERGQLVDGDQVLFIMAEYLAARNKLAGRRVVATVMSNLGLELALRARDIELARTQVGDKYVLEELLQGGGSLGGEQSGHTIFPEISLAGDGIITALEVLRAMAESGRSLSELTSGFTRCPQVMLNVRVARKPPFDTIAPIKAAAAALEEELAGQGRLLLRYSGTENLARVMIEGQDEATIRRQAEELAQIIKDNLS